MDNRKFVGIRQNGSVIVRFGDENAEVNGEEIEARSGGKFPSHSVTGFEWGYGGSGPAQLAYCMIERVFGHKLAERNYMRFKKEHVASFPEGDEGVVWTITVEDMRNFIKNEEDATHYCVFVYDDDNGETKVVENVNIFDACRAYDKEKRERDEQTSLISLKPMN